MRSRYTPGDPVIFRMSKHSTHPGPRARNIKPAAKGEEYTYQVDKFWTVAEVLEDGRLRLVTRRGKEHLVEPDDIHLRPAKWWERLLYRDRFPDLEELEES